MTIMKKNSYSSLVFLAILCMSIACTTSFAQTRSSKEDVLSVIHNRKSVRTYQDKKVTKDQLEVLMKAAMAAPTAVDRRPWIFIAVTDRTTLDKLSEGLPYAQMLKQASAAIVVCGDTTKAFPGDFWIMDCSAATENLLLAAEGTGLGAVWTAVYPEQERVDHVRKVLGIPSHCIPLNCIPIGYPTGIEKPKNKWDPANIHWEKW